MGAAWVGVAWVVAEALDADGPDDEAPDDEGAAAGLDAVGGVGGAGDGAGRAGAGCRTVVGAGGAGGTDAGTLGLAGAAEAVGPEAVGADEAVEAAAADEPAGLPAPFRPTGPSGDVPGAAGGMVGMARVGDFDEATVAASGVVGFGAGRAGAPPDAGGAGLGAEASDEVTVGSSESWVLVPERSAEGPPPPGRDTWSG